MNRHEDTWLTLEQLNVGIAPYQPTYDFGGGRPYIDGWHRRLAQSFAPDRLTVRLKNRRFGGHVIEGWLAVADALKLYEMAYFARGDILELGSYKGLSTFIMASAVKACGQNKEIVTVDLEPYCVAATVQNLDSVGLDKYTRSITSDAASAVRALHGEGRRFGFAFIDHSHAYQPVLDVCRELPSVMEGGGFCLFHDFNNLRNRDPEDKDYKVYQAVTESMDPERFEFWGIYGCTALYRVGKEGRYPHGAL